jgi:hypothetical protein
MIMVRGPGVAMCSGVPNKLHDSDLNPTMRKRR